MYKGRYMKHYYNNGTICKKFDPQIDIIPEGFVKGRLCFNLHTDNFKEKISSSVKKLWDDPEYRLKQSISHKHPVSKVVEKITVTDDVINMEISIKASIPKGFHIGKSEVDQSLIVSLTKKVHGTTGKISVTKNGCDRFICKEDLQLYLDAGYVKGGKSKKELRDYDHVWNKGLTKNSDSRVREMSEKLKVSNGVLGPNSEEIKKKISTTVKKRWEEGCFKNLVESHIGKEPWNKGLTKDTDSRVKAYGEKLQGKWCWCKGLTKDIDERLMKTSISLKKKNKHRVITDAQKERISIAVSKLWEEGRYTKFQPRTEELYYNFLLETHSKEDIKRNYNKDPRYPFLVDFYIISEDKFIELNLFPTHGSHPFDENSKEDQLYLEQLIANPKNVLDSQIANIWGHRDRIKFKIAKENKLHYEVLYWNDWEQFIKQHNINY